MAGHPIDSLFVEIGLDASKFDQQQREALRRFKQTQDAARKGARDVEDSGRSVVETLEGIKTQALEMFAVVAGGKGLIEFATQLTHADAALGRVERSTGIAGAAIGKWQALARIFGGDAKTMAQSFLSLSDAFAGWKVGAVSPLIADLRAISTAGGKIIDINKGVEQSFLDLAENLKNIHDKDPALAGFLGRKVGLDPALFDAMIQGNIQKVLELLRQVRTASEDDINTFGELEKRIGLMGVKAESLGRKMLSGDNGRGGLAAIIMEAADVLNMGPSEAWAYLNRTDRMALRAGQKDRGGLPGGPMFPQGPGTAASQPRGAFGSQAEKEAFIRAEAVKRGIDPDVAMRVARAEGFSNSIGDNGTSFGAFQLHVTPGGRGNAVGDQFRTQTGLDPSDPANERSGIAFALDDIRRNGWGAYHGAARSGVSQWAGVAAASGGGAGSVVTNTTNVTGPITINSGAGADGAKMASDFRAALIRRQSNVAQSDYGQN